MSLANPSNDSPLSYGILVYGNTSTGPNPPNDINIIGNDIFEISGAGISLGDYTSNVTIQDNNIHDIFYILTHLKNTNTTTHTCSIIITLTCF